MDNQLTLGGHADKFQFPARNIWRENGTAKRYADWWLIIIVKYQIKDGLDFFTFKVKNPSGGRPITEHMLTAKAADIIRTHSTSAGISHTSAKHDALQSVKRLADNGRDRIPADQNSPMRIASKAQRKALSKLWDERGHFSPSDFGRVTNRMKIAIGISPAVKKKQMTDAELIANSFAELVAENQILEADLMGKQAVESVSVKAAYDVGNLLNEPARMMAIASLRKGLE